MKVLKDSAIYMLGELLNRAIPFMLLPYLTRELGPAGYGSLSVYQSISLILVILIGMSLDGAVTRYYYRYGLRNIYNVINLGVAFSAVLTAIIVITALLNGSCIIAIVSLSAFFQFILKVTLAFFQCQKQPIKYIKVQLIAGILNLIVTLVLFELFSASAENRIIAILLANLLIGGSVYLVLFASHLPLPKRKKNNYLCLSYIISFGFPLVFHNLAIFLKGQADKLILASTFSLSDVGLYSSGYQLASIFLILFTAINKGITPYFYAAAKKGSLTEKKVRFISLCLFVLLPFLYFPFSIASDYVAYIILGKDFLGAGYFFSIFILGFLFVPAYYVLVNYLFYMGKTKVIASATILTSLMHFSAVYFLSKVKLSYVPFSLVFSNITLVIVLYTCVYLIGKGNVKKSEA